MDDDPVEEGKAPFSFSGLESPCETYYKIFGDLRSGHPPLIILHGGPGSAHEYLLTFAKLWRRSKIPVILYDQIGCGGSTRLRSKADDKSFWTVDMFVQELENLIQFLKLTSFNVLGHSWGGVLGAYFATRQPQGLQKLVVASAPAQPDNAPHWFRRRWNELSQEAQDVMAEADRTGDYKSQSFRDSYMTLRRTFWCRAEPFPPKELAPIFVHQADDTTVANMMYGTSPLECNGALSGWTMIPSLSKIKVPTLAYHGEYDTIPDDAIEPYLANIPKARKVKIANASHMAHVDSEESQEKVLDMVSKFLLEDEAI